MVAKKKKIFIQQVFWKAVKKMSQNIKQWNEQLIKKKKKHSGSTQKSNIQPTWVLQRQNRENRGEETVMKKKG